MTRCRGCGERCDSTGTPLAVHPDCRVHGVHSVTVPGMSLDPALARKLRRAADQVKAATELRNQLIHEASESASLRDIAEHAGVSHVAVLKILRRYQEGKPT